MFNLNFLNYHTELQPDQPNSVRENEQGSLSANRVTPPPHFPTIGKPLRLFKLEEVNGAYKHDMYEDTWQKKSAQVRRTNTK